MQPLVEQMDSFLFKGKEEQYTLPSGLRVTIRELNGDDEGLLSNVVDATTGDNIIKFLSSIITKVEDSEAKVMPSEISGWLVNDVFYLLLMQRILNHGDEMIFQVFCNNKQCSCHDSKTKKPLEYEVHLKDYFIGGIEKTAAKKYPNGPALIQEVTLPKSGLKIRFRIHTHASRHAAEQRPDNQLDKNTSLLDHSLEVWMQDKYQLMTFFRAFNSRQMDEIRGAVREADTFFDPFIEYECPECGTWGISRVFAAPTFFYPGERI